MKITLVKDTFLRAAALTGQAVGPRPSLPVLNNFLLSAQSGVLELSATNLESTIVYKIPSKVVEKGQTTVSARTLIDFCQSAGGDQILLEEEKENIRVESEKASALIPTINASEFPTTKQFKTEQTTALSKKGFLEGAAQVALCAAPEEGRPILTGVLIEGDGKQMTEVATDGYRLAKKEISGGGELNVVVPARALKEAAKAIAEQEDDNVRVSSNNENNQIKFETKNLTVLSRLLEGDYPNYEQIIPNSFVCEAVVDTKTLIDSIKTASLFAKDVGNVVRFDVAKNKMNIYASTAQVGEAKVELSIKQGRGDLKTAFNSRFLLESLGALNSKQTAVRFSGPTSAALLEGVGDKSLLHIVMPVRAQS
jgi:DNA polymerase-3 subunit beta